MAWMQETDKKYIFKPGDIQKLKESLSTQPVIISSSYLVMLRFAYHTRNRVAQWIG
jgi:hypothetical protein